ncbi:uncharacterized protein LOC119483197 [Sebastes umbrosus]|uniref:uncharacterized protein LOC119483197 n=1 Tax=Sebastes umbrosus TaxID=72105 RepID=UPI0018A07B9E|nr:uncharacterized protein LOC119483197 [Sebastes umbrosus]
MNWVGGSRNRFVVKNDAKKQREFFEKRKMQQKLRNLGVSLPASPGGSNVSSGSMDLVTLFIVNQIAAKKDIKDPPKVAVLGSSKGGSKHKRNEPLVLPMSPCSPSQLSLVEGSVQAQYSAQGTRKRKHVIPQGFKCRQLSPVLESAFSDNSASDYLTPITDPLSPFSSTSSASSGQGMFPLQLNLQQRGQTQAQLPPRCSPRPWDTSGLEQTKFQPFSQPRGMTDCVPWSCGSNPPLYQLETPTAARVLFTSPEPDNTEAGDQARREVIFSLNQPEDKEPLLDFTLNQSETERQFEGDVFRGFSTEECERKGSHFGSGTSKIYLKDETPATSSAPQTVPDPQCMEVEGSDIIHLSNYTDVDFSCLEHNSGPMNGCEYSPSYSCRRGYLSSDSDDEEECCQPCLLQAASSYMDQACCADILNPNQGNPQQRPTKHPRPPTPLPKPQMNIRDNRKIMENVVFQVKASGSDSSTAQFASPQAQSSVCKCKKTPGESRDAGTQTVYNPTAETRDASTQCSVVADVEATGLYLPPPVDVSVQHPATGRQSDTAAKPHTPPSGKAGRGEKPWTEKKPRGGSLSGSSVINKHTDGRVRPINPFLDALSITGGRGKENREGREERGQQENGRVMKDLSIEAREEVTSGIRANGLSEEAETLQEIADILLLLKQKREVR